MRGMLGVYVWSDMRWCLERMRRPGGLEDLDAWDTDNPSPLLGEAFLVRFLTTFLLYVSHDLQALSRAAESALQRFTEHPPAVLSGGDGGDSDEETKDRRVLELRTTALPGALEVFLVRATDLQEVILRYCIL